MAYVPPHLRGAQGNAGSACRALGMSGGGLSTQQHTVAASGGSTDASKSRTWGGNVSPSSGPVAQGVWRREAGSAKPAAERRTPTAAVESIPLRVVEIDSLVLMKIIKHWRDFHPLPVNGQLLGVEAYDRLEITNCFPLPQKKEILAVVQQSGQDKSLMDLEERVDEEFDRYQDKMAELMHDVKVDCFTVGWYQTLTAADLKTREIVETMVGYQELVEKAVMLAFDPVAHAEGLLPLKAYHVDSRFLKKFHELESDPSQINRMRAKDILVEDKDKKEFFQEVVLSVSQVPISIQNAFLSELFLLHWNPGPPPPEPFSSLSPTPGASVERGLSFLSSCLELMSDEQDRLHKYQRDALKQQLLQRQLVERRRLENEQRRLRGEPLLPEIMDGPAFKRLEAPSQLNALLMASQAASQADDVTENCGETISKMFLVKWGSEKRNEDS